MPVDRRIPVTVRAKGKKPVKAMGCVVCEKVIPGSDKMGVETGACSSECYESPDYSGYLEDQED